MSMTIAYDVSHIRRQRAGIGRLATIQLHGLLSADKHRNYILHGWAPELDTETIQSFRQSNVRLSIAQMPGIVKRLHWNYLRFPPLTTLIGNFDIFHCAEPLVPPVGKKKSIITFNDSSYYKFPHFFSPVTARKWDYLYRRSLQKADRVIVLSENTRADLMGMMALPPERVHVVRPPTDPFFFEPRTHEDERRVGAAYALPEEFVLFVGTLEPRKNVPALIGAFELFRKGQTHDISLVIAGRRGWLYEDILKTVDASPERKSIRLLDYVPDPDLAVIYRLARMFVFPSFYEGHGFPVVEAMASGTPVITSDNSSLREIAHDAALLVDPENTLQISESMRLLYRDEGLRTELASKGRARAAEFSVKDSVDSIRALYDSLENEMRSTP